MAKQNSEIKLLNILYKYIPTGIKMIGYNSHL